MDQDQKYHHLSSQVRILYDQSLLTFLFPIVVAPLVCLLLWEIADTRRLLLWAGIVIIYSLSRYGIIWQEKKTGISPENVNQWLDLLIACVFISGILWGSAGIFLVPYDSSRLIEFTIYNSLTMLVVCGLVAGAVVTYSVNRWVIFFYAFPALVPPAIYLVYLGDKYNSSLGGFVFLYFLFITASSFRLSKQYEYYIDLEYQLLKMSGKFRIDAQVIQENN